MMMERYTNYQNTSHETNWVIQETLRTDKHKSDVDAGIVIAIEIKGTADNTIVDFTSTPSMPEEEILALLLFGKKLGEVSVLQSVQLAELARSEDKGKGFFEKMRDNFIDLRETIESIKSKNEI